MVKKYKCKVKSHDRTPFTYENNECFNYMNLHDWIKYKKLGYSKVTDQLCREIRFGRISRKNASEIKLEYEVIKPKYLQIFADWLGLSTDGLNYLFNLTSFVEPSGSSSLYGHLRDEKNGVDFDLMNKDDNSSKYILYGKALYI